MHCPNCGQVLSCGDRVSKVKMSTYMREAEIATRATCIQSMKRLEEQKQATIAAHTLEVSGLETRVRACQEMIDRINDRLAIEDSTS